VAKVFITLRLLELEFGTSQAPDLAELPPMEKK
jgi:hypothetical protein